MFLASALNVRHSQTMQHCTKTSQMTNLKFESRPLSLTSVLEIFERGIGERGTFSEVTDGAGNDAGGTFWVGSVSTRAVCVAGCSYAGGSLASAGRVQTAQGPPARRFVRRSYASLPSHNLQSLRILRTHIRDGQSSYW